MQPFKFREDGFKQIKRKTLFITVPIIVIAGVAVIAINTMAGKGIDAYTLIFIVFFLAFLVFALYRTLSRQKALLESYTLTINNNTITREQLNTQTISIPYDDVKEIVKHKNGRFTIRGTDPADIIYVPAQIERADELEAALNSLILILPKSQEPDLQRYRGLIQMAALACMLGAFVSSNKFFVLVAGTGYTILTIWYYNEVRKNKNIDLRTKQRMWWLFVRLALVIAVIIMKLTWLPV